jgi:hypothetical protein
MFLLSTIAISFILQEIKEALDTCMRVHVIMGNETMHWHVAVISKKVYCFHPPVLRILHPLAMEDMAGLSFGTRTLRIRVSFYSVFKVERGKSILYLLGRKKAFCGFPPSGAKKHPVAF